MMWFDRLSRLSDESAGDGCGTQRRPPPEHGGVPALVTAMVAFVTVIVGVAPQVTATRVEASVSAVVPGPMQNSASPVGGGVRLSRSAGRNPKCNPEEVDSCIRAVSPWIICVRSKT